MSFDILWEEEGSDYKVICVSDNIYASVKEAKGGGWLIYKKTTNLETAIDSARAENFKSKQLELNLQ